MLRPNPSTFIGSIGRRRVARQSSFVFGTLLVAAVAAACSSSSNDGLGPVTSGTGDGGKDGQAPGDGAAAKDSQAPKADSGNVADSAPASTTPDTGAKPPVADSGAGPQDSGGTVDSGGGGGTPGPCTWGTPFNGSASFTNYYFGQGTGKANDGNYLTACGYEGTESGQIDTVMNIANNSPAKNTYFAAVPGMNNFNTVNDCGACVEITNGGNKIVATIIDECPTDNGQNGPCMMAGHLDLSVGAFQALGYSNGDPSGTTWKFVPCPLTGNIVAVQKPGNGDMVFLQNAAYPIMAVTSNGQAANHLSYGPWQLANGEGAAGATLTITDSVNQTLTITVPGGFGDTGKQFTAGTGCY